MQTYRSANLQTDHMVSQSEVARMLNVSERSVSGHGAGHEASNVYAIKRSTIPVVNWPNHRPPNPVRLGYHCLGRYIPPFVLDANAIVAILGFPIRVQHDTTISIGETGALGAHPLDLSNCNWVCSGAGGWRTISPAPSARVGFNRLLRHAQSGVS